ncbi:MAG: hypothetical protein KatS3mg094_240 [Candidatus Parcubacteria bacterium]|nr:MAG: hypothetical protein KatS3mg094_240 [Candidatus Parcubacteria bacterium]
MENLWYKNTPLFISFISFIEILSYPKLKDGDILVIKNFLNKFSKIYINDDISELAAELKRRYNLKIGDAIIAATAIYYKQILVTKDITDFKKVKEIQLLDFLNKRFLKINDF